MTFLSVLFRVINILLMIGTPCLAGVFLFKRGKYGFRPIWIGAAGFILSQVGHLPFNRFLLMPGLRELGVDLAARSGPPLVALGVAAGLSAGVFEEFTRYFIFRFWLKKEQGRLLPVKYALGHGGLESLLVGILALAAFIQVLALAGPGSLAGFEPRQAELIRSQLQAYWAVPWEQSLLGAWERISALLFHGGASLLVYRSVQRKRIGWLLAAVAGHALMNALAVIGVQRWNLFLLEGLIFVLAAVWAWWAWKLPVQEEGPEELDSPGVPDLQRSTAEITRQDLEESRYD